MRRIVAVVALVAFLTGACDRGPSITRVKCNALLAAVDHGDADDVNAAFQDILDIGTEEEPEAVDPKIYTDALLVASYLSDGDQVGFGVAMDQLVADCRTAQNLANITPDPGPS